MLVGLDEGSFGVGGGMWLLEGESPAFGGDAGVGMGVLPVSERFLLAKVDFKEGADGEILSRLVAIPGGLHR